MPCFQYFKCTWAWARNIIYYILFIYIHKYAIHTGGRTPILALPLLFIAGVGFWVEPNPPCIVSWHQLNSSALVVALLFQPCIWLLVEHMLAAWVLFLSLSRLLSTCLTLQRYVAVVDLCSSSSGLLLALKIPRYLELSWMSTVLPSTSLPSSHRAFLCHLCPGLMTLRHLAVRMLNKLNKIIKH